ncbi:MAG TPA: RES family NAD+ phosphorylase [Desulfopila sp.]|nr:RES family NAD+ phosphorylase [Desulfopila sp.]
MEICAYRLIKQKRWKSAFTGEGARLYGGRWNRQGVPLVYTSDSLALACLEILVHLPSSDLLQDYIYMEAVFSSDLVVNAQLVDGWNARPVPAASQSIGDRWVRDKTSPVLRVPSVIVPKGSNYLLNISHPDFEKITLGDPVQLDFDSRLQKK